MLTTRRILILAGEASGDLLGAHLAKAILAINPNIALIGMGGNQMKAAGVDILIDADKLAVVGTSEILKHFKDIFSAMSKLKKLFKTTPPDLVIFIDYPGFNLRMAKHAKNADIQVLYYVSPQIWAWHYSRIKQIKKYVDHMAVLFAFEERMYQKENMPVSFVGHPIVDIAKPTLNRKIACQQFNLDPQQPIIALFPGSRHSEVSRLMPVIIETAQLIRKKIPAVQFVLPLAASINISDIRTFLIPAIKIIKNDTHNILPLCQAAITASGTATLEIALHKVPMIVIYKTSPLTYWLGKNLINLTCIGLCNIVAEKIVAKEFIQHKVDAEEMASEIVRFLEDPAYHRAAVSNLTRVKENLGSGGCSHKAAQVALEMLSAKNVA